MYNPHDERMNAYYVSVSDGHGNRVYDSREGDTVFCCCIKHLKEDIKREFPGCKIHGIRRAWDWENIYMRGNPR